jgi:hypothetical protein
MSSHHTRDDTSNIFQRSRLHGSVQDPISISLKSAIKPQHPNSTQEKSTIDTAPAQVSIANSILVKEEIRLADEVRKEIKAFKRVAWLPGSFTDLVTLYGSDFLDPNIE